MGANHSSVSAESPFGCGLRVSSVGRPFGFSASRYSTHALAAARHTSELSPDPSVLLHVDEKMMGVGGDTGWTRSVHSPYLVPPGTYRWARILRPLAQCGSATKSPTSLPYELLIRTSNRPAFVPQGRGDALRLWLMTFPRVAIACVVLLAVLAARLRADSN